MWGVLLSEVLLELIKKGLNSGLIYLQPSRPCLTIMEGAVLFGKNPSTIDIRKTKYTIGINFRDIWDDKKHSEKGIKYFDNECNKYFCKNCFYKFIEINQNIKLEEKIMRKFYMVDKRYCTILLYKTIKPSPIFVFEEGVLENVNLMLEKNTKLIIEKLRLL